MLTIDENSIFSLSENEMLKTLLKNPKEDYHKIISLVEEKIKNLKESGEKYRNLINGIMDITIENDLSGKFLYVSPQVYDVLGYRPEEIIGKSGFDFIHPDDLKVAAETLREAISKRDRVNVEYRTRHKNGHYIYVSASGKIVNVVGESRVVAIIRDITERKKAEQKLKESEERYRYLIENALEGVWVLDSNLDTVLVNPSMANILGYSVEGMLGKSVLAFMDGEDAELTELYLERRKEGVSDERDAEFLHKEGHKVYLRIRGTPIFDNQGKFEGTYAFLSDITERKLAEQKLIESEEKFRSIFESIPIGIHVYRLDSNGELIFSDANPEADSILKIENKQFVNKTIEEAFPPLIETDIPNRYKLIAKEGDVWKWDQVDYADNQIQGAYEVVAFQTGPNNMVTTFTDISERIESEKKIKESEEKFRTMAEQSLIGIFIVQDDVIKYTNQRMSTFTGYTIEEMLNWKPREYLRLVTLEYLDFVKEQVRKKQLGLPDVIVQYPVQIIKKSGDKIWIENFSKTINYDGRTADFVSFIDITDKKKAEEELIRLNELKSEFLRRISHELKTPLVSVKGFTDLLLQVYKDELSEEVLSIVDSIRKGSGRLESLIGDILKTAELKSGAISIKGSTNNLSSLIRHCVKEFYGIAKLRNLTINLKIQENLTTVFEKEQIYQVINNLLSNALKYTPSGGKIEINSNINENFIIISIKDNGIGFTEKEKEMLFTEFGKIERYGQGLDIVPEGSGLGLFISKKIVELHGGDLWVVSEGRYKGSTFYFSLPVKDI